MAQGMQKTGEAIGKGIGEAVAAYQLEASQKEINAQAAKGLTGEFPYIQSMLEGQIKATPAQVVKDAQDPNNMSSDVVAYRARLEALDGIGKDISGFANKNSKGQQAIIGKYTILAKSARQWHDDQAAAATAARLSAKDAAEGVRTAEASRNAAIELAHKTAGKRGADAYGFAKQDAAKAAIYTRETAVDESKPIYEELSQIVPLISSPDKDTSTAARARYEQLVQGLTNINTAYTDSLDRERIIKTENEKDLKSIEFNGNVAKGKAALEAYKAQYKEIARIGVEALPKPQQEEARWLKKDIDELDAAIADAEKTGKPLDYRPSSIAEKNVREYTASKAAEIYELRARAEGIPVTSQMKEFVYQTTYFNGETTPDGYDVKADEKTGMLTVTRNADWIRWYQSTYEHMDPTQKAAFDKWQQDTNTRLANLNSQRFGIVNEQGKLIARQFLWDRFNGSGNIYIRGQLNISQKDAAELHEMLLNENAVNMALGGIMDHLIQKDASGSPIKNTDGTYKQRDISKFDDSEKRAYAVKIAEFIRAKAKGLGVLSKQDWEYLNALAPNIVKQFGENYDFSNQGVSGIADMILNKFTVTTDVVLPRIQSQMKNVGEKIRLRLSNYTTVEGKPLEVTAGEARDIEGKEYDGERLRGWWNTVSTAKTSDYTYQNRLEELNGLMTQVWSQRNLGGGDPSSPQMQAYAEVLRQITAELRSRGLSDKQIKSIISDNFPR